jgi:hypothetical protein
MLSSVLPKKNPTAHSNGLSKDSANAAATMWLDFSTSGPTGRTMKEHPSMSISITFARERIGFDD